MKPVWSYSNYKVVTALNIGVVVFKGWYVSGSIQGEACCFCCNLRDRVWIPFRCWSLSTRLCSASVTLALVCELLISALQVQAILFVSCRHHDLLTQHLFTFAVLQWIRPVYIPIHIQIYRIVLYHELYSGLWWWWVLKTHWYWHISNK